MAEIFQYLVVLMLAVWTAKLAITKGRNGWIWGCAALVLGLLPWHLIGVIPVLALMFIKGPTNSPNMQERESICPRCNKSYVEGQHFCTGCGWDLSQEHPIVESAETQAKSNQPQIPTTVPSTGAVQSHEPAEESKIATELISDDIPVPNINEEPTLDSGTVSDHSEEAYVPWGTYDVGEAPTAPTMVSRGLERFNEGKFQEAIDQFTKAIALDPDYAEAWERRSEAYSQLGRSQQAEDDRQHLRGLGPSSSPG